MAVILLFVFWLCLFVCLFPVEWIDVAVLLFFSEIYYCHVTVMFVTE